MTQSVYDAAGGSGFFVELAHAWHRRCLADPVVSHAFSHGYHPEHSERLAAYWAEALGGPAAFTAAMGDETAVLRMHSGNGEHAEMDRRAEVCFDGALEDVGAADARLFRTLSDYFRWANVAMGNYHRSAADVPDGLQVPRWSWDGPVAGETQV